MGHLRTPKIKPFMGLTNTFLMLEITDDFTLSGLFSIVQLDTYGLNHVLKLESWKYI